MTAKIIPFPLPDREPQPSDGPDYHADHAAWEARHGVPVEIKQQIDFDLEPSCDRCIEYMEGASGQYCLAFNEMLMSVRQADGCLCFTEA